MNCQILLPGKNKKNVINLSSAENAQRVVKVKALSLCFTFCAIATFTLLLRAVKNYLQRFPDVMPNLLYPSIVV